jgi:hypothetical protein
MADAGPIVSRRTCCGASSGPLSDERRKGPPIRIGPRRDGRTVRGPAGFRAVPRRAGEGALLKGRFTIDRRCAGLCRGAGACRQTALTRGRRVGRGLAGGEAAASEVALGFAFGRQARAERRDRGGGPRREVDDAPRSASGITLAVLEARLKRGARRVGRTSRGLVTAAHRGALGALVRTVGKPASARRVAHAVLDADNLAAPKQVGSSSDGRDAPNHTHP